MLPSMLRPLAQAHKDTSTAAKEIGLPKQAYQTECLVQDHTGPCFHWLYHHAGVRPT